MRSDGLPPVSSTIRFYDLASTPAEVEARQTRDEWLGNAKRVAKLRKLPGSERLANFLSAYRDLTEYWVFWAHKLGDFGFFIDSAGRLRRFREVTRSDLCNAATVAYPNWYWWNSVVRQLGELCQGESTDDDVWNFLMDRMENQLSEISHYELEATKALLGSDSAQAAHIAGRLGGYVASHVSLKVNTRLDDTIGALTYEYGMERDEVLLRESTVGAYAIASAGELLTARELVNRTTTFIAPTVSSRKPAIHIDHEGNLDPELASVEADIDLRTWIAKAMLSRQEGAVSRLLMEGFTQAEIARKFGVAGGSINTVVARIRRKLKEARVV